jgi:hypothetical protein
MSGAQAQRQVEGGESCERQAREVRARLREALVERLLIGMQDVHDRLARFLKNPGRVGAVHLTLVLSESSVTHEVWKEPSTVPERRARMARTLGLSPEVDDASLLRALMADVHQAFVDFQASAAGREARRRYEELLAACEVADVLPIIPAHDTGPMLAELERVGMVPEKDFTRSLLVDARILSVAPSPEDCSASPLMIAGPSVSQLGALVAHVRSLNPRLTNRQVRKLLLRASTQDGKNAPRKSLGQAEVERVLEFTRQLLRFQVVELLFV